MPQLSSKTLGGMAAGPVPDAIAAGSCVVGGTNSGVPLSIWPGLPALNGAQGGRPCGEPATAAARCVVIDAFSRPADLVGIAVDCLLTVIEAAAAAGRRFPGLVPGRGPALHRRSDPAALPRPGNPQCICVVPDAVVKGEPA